MSQGIRAGLAAPARAAGILLACCALAATCLLAAGGARPADAADPAAKVVQAARGHLGDRYVWGATGPTSWDCSGLTSTMWRDAGGVRSIPRVAADQQAWAVPIPREQLLAGDLVFFGAPVTHVALYVAGDRVIDASSSHHAVVERLLWSAGVVRYGRVPRAGMPAVRPWTPPPAPSTGPFPGSSPAGADRDGASAEAPDPGGTGPHVVAVVDPPAGAVRAALVEAPLRGLPSPDRPAPDALSTRALANARTVLWNRGWNDLDLIRVAWRHAGGGALPATRSGIAARAAVVPLSSARLGDLVVYGVPASHLGLYVGHGFMIDTMRGGAVVVRRVFAGADVRLERLPAR